MSIGRHGFVLGTVLKWTALTCIVAGLLSYGVFQARLLIAGPSIALASDTRASQTERVVVISGVARNVTEITLNDRPLFTDDDGNFRERLVLEDGYTIMTIRAKDRYGREKVLTQPFVYAPAYEAQKF